MEAKPIPVPRKRLPVITKLDNSEENGNTNYALHLNETHDKTCVYGSNEGDGNSASLNRPVPLPRSVFSKTKLPKIPPQQEIIVEESGESSHDEDLPSCLSERRGPLTPEERKRRTVSLFPRKGEDPFGEDFEKSLQDAPLKTCTDTMDFENSSTDCRFRSWTRFHPSAEALSDCNANRSESDENDCSENPDTMSDEIRKSAGQNFVLPYFPATDLFNSSGVMELCSGENVDGVSEDSARIPKQLPASSMYERISSYSSSESGISSEDNHVFGVAERDSPRNCIPKPCPKFEVNFDAAEDAQVIFQSSVLPPHFSTNNIPKEQVLDETVSNYKKVNKPKRNEYDDVAIEDGQVIIRRSATSAVSNVTPVVETKTEKPKKQTESVKNPVVLEFDPLFQKDSSVSTFVECLDEIESFIPGTNSSRAPIVSNKTDEYRRSMLDAALPESFGNKEMGEDTPPAVPERRYLKSPPERELPVVAETMQSPETNTRPARSKEKGIYKISQRISGMLSSPGKEVSMKVTKSVLEAKCLTCGEEHNEATCCKFTLKPQDYPDFGSVMYKLQGLHKKEYIHRWAVLSKGNLYLYNKAGETKFVDTIQLDKVLMVIKKEGRTQQLQGLSCFQFQVKSSKLSSWNLAASNDNERSMWMQKYIETFISLIPTSITSDYEVAGWGFMKEGVISPWRPCWLILSERKLFYAYLGGEEFFVLDLRKVRSLALKKKEDKTIVAESTDVLTIDSGTKILYFQTTNSKVTGSWEKCIRAATFYNGNTFEEMQLTNDNVPVIVEKCIEFLYGYGVIAEGIYRHSGSISRMNGLLEEFKKDAWSVQISELSAHDVAGALKRFFRTLPEPVVTNKLYTEWINAYNIQDRMQQLEKYKSLLDQLPLINYNILKKLFCHLYTIHELHERNLMPLENLAPIWGPTLMSVDQAVEDSSEIVESYGIACAQCGVVKDLIENYYMLFSVNADEIDREKKIQQVLERIHFGGNKKRSGDMRIYVYVNEYKESNAANISLSPTATAASILESIAKQKHLRGCETLAIFEVIPSRSLERPLYPTEQVMDTVVRWPVLDDLESKSNYLIVKSNPLYIRLVPYANELPTIRGDYNFAESRSKYFRKCNFEFSNGTLRCLKDSKGSSGEYEDWNIKDIVWYMGHEPKRSPPTQWSITFVSKIIMTPAGCRDSRTRRGSKDEHVLGNVISFPSEEEMYRLVAAFIIGEHSAGLFPSVIF